MNLKKCQFYKDEIQFLSFVISANGIRMKVKKIKAIKEQPEPKSVKYIQVFLGFANLYRKFIRNFSKIVVPLISIIQTIVKSTDGNSQGIQASNQDAPGSVEITGVDSVSSDNVGGTIENLSTVTKLNKFKSINLAKCKKSTFPKDFAKINPIRTDFLTSGAKQVFLQL